MTGSDRDDVILAALLREADLLCDSDDALMIGQYRHLRARIAALIEERRAVGLGTQ